MQTNLEADKPAITAEELEFQAWLALPQTSQFLAYLQDLKKEAQEGWAKRKFAGNSLEEGALRNAAALGEVALLDDLINLTYKDIEAFYHERSEDKQFERYSPQGKQGSSSPHGY